MKEKVVLTKAQKLQKYGPVLSEENSELYLALKGYAESLVPHVGGPRDPVQEHSVVVLPYNISKVSYYAELHFRGMFKVRQNGNFKNECLLVRLPGVQLPPLPVINWRQEMNRWWDLQPIETFASSKEGISHISYDAAYYRQLTVFLRGKDLPVEARRRDNRVRVYRLSSV